MKMLKGLLKFSGRMLMAFMFAVCMVLGVVPIIPKRKEQFGIEIKMEEVEKKHAGTVSFNNAEKK